MYEVRWYEDEKGRRPAVEFLEGLQVGVRAKVAKWLEKLEEKGPALPRPHADVVRGKIRELRVVFGGNQYRLLYFFHGREIVVTHGFVKKSGRIPAREVERAERMRREFIER